MGTAIFHHPSFALHETGAGHPERGERVRAVEEALRRAPYASELTWHTAPPIERSALERVHDAAYVDSVHARAPEQGLARLDEDTVVGPHSLDAALRAAGAVAGATELVLSGGARTAFCNVRPPGHHAESGRAMGFCLFDNIAVGLAQALDVHGLQRAAVIDFDVHHGNGTEDILSADSPYAERVLFCSSFEHPLYPGTGADTRRENILNVPLPAGTAGPAFREAVAERWFGALEAFAPELVFFSAGFDAHADDPLANLQLQAEDYAWITEEVHRATKAHTGGRIVSSLEGGYALQALADSAVAHVAALNAAESD